MNFGMKQWLGLACTAAALSLLAPACGPSNNDGGDCPDGQRLASIGGGPNQCYTECDGGMCPDGFMCTSGLCIAGSSNNMNNTTGMNSTTSNNTTSNNTTSNNTTSNNTTSNNTTSNNTNNPPACPGELDMPLGACDPVCQSGCMAGQACVAGGSPAMTVCQAPGTAAEGETCGQATGGCQTGLGCIVTEAGAMEGTCQEYCKIGDDTTCATAGATCGGVLDQASGLGVCVVPEDACDPLNDMCPDGQKCANTNLGLQCFATAGGMAGETCDVSNTMQAPCDKGLICAQVGNEATCQILCDPADGSNCPMDTTCMAGMDPTVGICI